MSFERELERWDGRSDHTIRQIYERHLHSVSFVSRLIDALLTSPELQNGASRLFRMYCEGGKPIPLPEVRRLLNEVSQVSHWVAKLNILQTIRLLRIPIDSVADTRTFLDACMADETILVQAWAYSAYADLARQHPDMKDEVTSIFDEALSADLPGIVMDRVEKALGSHQAT